MSTECSSSPGEQSFYFLHICGRRLPYHITGVLAEGPSVFPEEAWAGAGVKPASVPGLVSPLSTAAKQLSV